MAGSHERKCRHPDGRPDDGRPTSLVTNDVFFAGFDTEALVATRPSVRKDAQYLQPNSFLGARDIRVMAKIRF